MKRKIPRQNSICRFTLGEAEAKYAHEYPFKIGERVLFLGEIPNMAGHCIIVSGWKRSIKDANEVPVLQSCDITYGWHTDNFVELTEDEV